ncbi:hypothetical protein CFI03_000155 [Paenibacillus sp. ATY16]|nr:hypothetical protein [Paenibacillus sp. ATY16]
MSIVAPITRGMELGWNHELNALVPCRESCVFLRSKNKEELEEQKWRFKLFGQTEA